MREAVAREVTRRGHLNGLEDSLSWHLTSEAGPVKPQSLLKELASLRKWLSIAVTVPLRTTTKVVFNKWHLRT